MVSRILRGLATLTIIAATMWALPHSGYAALPGRRGPTIPVDRLPFTVHPDRLHGLVGDEITVTFHNSAPEDGYLIQSCAAWFAYQPWSKPLELPAKCSRTIPEASDSDWAATVVVPKPNPDPQGIAYLHWTLTYGGPAGELKLAELPAAGDVPFTIFTVDVTATPTTTDPGRPITVDFTAPSGVPGITGCHVSFAGRTADCSREGEARKSVLIRVPADLEEPEPVPLVWHFTYAGGKPEETGDGDGTIPISVSLPPPEFDVRPESLTARPGVPFTVAFISQTRGVDITGCGITLHQRAECSRSGIAVLIVPPDTPPDTTLTIPWDLSYVSSRPGEKSGSRKGTLRIPVEVTEPDFAVTVEPASAAPGEEITLSFRSLVEGIEIVDCAAFFPHALTGTCQRSPERWVARTTVPEDAQPGALLLRWGVASRTADGAPGTDSDVIAYPVTRAKTSTKPSTHPTTTPPAHTTTTTPPTTTPTTEPTAPTSSPIGGTSIDRTDNGLPAFVATTDPESAAPGESVLVTVSPVDPTAQVTECVVAFSSHRGTRCGQDSGRWSASVRVPDEAEPDTDVPLSWSATSRTVAGNPDFGSGTILYRVLPADVPKPPAFSVLPQPAAAAAGERVAVSFQSLVSDVATTGCQAGFAAGPMADCRQTSAGWVADVSVPASAKPGNEPIHWTLAYGRAGEADGSTDGLVSFYVQPGTTPPAHGVWAKLWPFAWRILLGGVLLAGLIGWRRLARAIRGRPAPQRSGEPDAELPETVRVVPILPVGRFDVQVRGADTTARHRIRLTFHRPIPRVHVQEAPP